MLPISSVVEVNGLSFDVRMKDVVVKEIREALVQEILNRLLERNHAPFHHNVFFDGTYLL